MFRSLFSSHTQTSSTTLSVARKRRTMQLPVVVRALVSSAAVPISEGLDAFIAGDIITNDVCLADAQESIKMLMALCPFFLRPLVIAGEDWLEMPAANTCVDMSHFCFHCLMIELVRHHAPQALEMTRPTRS